jgi:hypothetical protein
MKIALLKVWLLALSITQSCQATVKLPIKSDILLNQLAAVHCEQTFHISFYHNHLQSNTFLSQQNKILLIKMVNLQSTPPCIHAGVANQLSIRICIALHV